MPKRFVLPLMLLLLVVAGGQTPAEGGELRLAQRRPHDRGNCFHWKGCRGESLGHLWTYDPDRCKAIGGKSWLDESGQCYDLPDGIQVVPNPPAKPSR